MKRLVLVAMLAGALAACGDAAEEAGDTTTAAATPEATPAVSSAGTYDVTMADGTKFMAMLNPDGTYQDMDADGTVTESGTWEDRADGKTCFDPEGENNTVQCFTVGEPAEDGSSVATPDDGSEPLTIKKTS